MGLGGILSSIGGIFNGGSSNPNDGWGGTGGYGMPGGGQPSGPGGIWQSIQSNPLQWAMLGLGLYGNISANNQRNTLFNTYSQMAQKYANMTPADWMTRIQGFQQPLTRGLQQSVGNSVQADLAQRGLSAAPGIYTQAMAQAMAPYALKNQEDAIQAATGTMFNPGQLPWAVGSLAPQPSNLSNLMRTLMMLTTKNGQSGQQDSGLSYNFPGQQYPSIPGQGPDMPPPDIGWQQQFPAGVLGGS